MRASKFSDAQTAFVLTQCADNLPAADICREAGINQPGDLLQIEKEIRLSAYVSDATDSQRPNGRRAKLTPGFTQAQATRTSRLRSTSLGEAKVPTEEMNTYAFIVAAREMATPPNLGLWGGFDMQIKVLTPV